MFYYPAVLRRHTGCFSTIWLVATRGIKITRREFLQVNVSKTCDDIMEYLLERVQPPRAGLPRPRLSLYLSSQLQFGVIVVYHRQCVILLQETQSMVNWLLKQNISQKNDMDDSKQASLLKDVLSLMVETEGAADPLFGNMYIQDQPSPRSLFQGHLRQASPQHPGQEETPLTWSPTSDDRLGRGITASPETITLREPEPVPIPVTEFEGIEFGDHPGDTINLLLAQTGQFFEGDILREVPIPEPETDVEREQERREADTDRDRTKEQTESTAELQPTTLSSENHMMPPQEEPDLPLQPVKPPTDQLTPVSAPVRPSPPSVADRRKRRREESESESSPEERKRRRRRRRQLVFIDLETQLPQEEMQQQINDLQIQTAAASILPSPSHVMPPAVELFNNPCTSFMPEELLSLWRQAATITPIAGSDLQAMERGPESSESEREREREMAEMLEMAEREEQERREESSKEFPRDEAEVEQLDISAMTALPLEASDQMEASRESSPLVTPVKERSVVSRPVSALKDIPEETADEAEGPKPCSPGLLPELEHEAGPVHFLSSLPPGATRRTVSHYFMKLLDDLSARKLQAEQREPYGDIVLSVFSESLDSSIADLF